MRTLAAALLCIAATAAADVSAPGGEKPPSPPSCSLEKARDHYRRAVKHYDLAEYDAAVAEFQKAFVCRPEPAIVYDIAQCQRMANHLPEALASYRSYLRLRPDAPNRADVEQKIAELDLRLRKPGNE